MKFNLNNPAFLQMAGNVGGSPQESGIEMIFSVENPSFPIGGNSVTIKSIVNGEVSEVTGDFSAGSTTTINADANTPIYIQNATVIKGTISGPTFLDNLISFKVLKESQLFANASLGYTPSLSVFEIAKRNFITDFYLSYSLISHIQTERLTYCKDFSAYKLENITSIDLSNKLELKNVAIKNMSNLTSLNLLGCASLTSLSLGSSNESGPDPVNPVLTEIKVPVLTSNIKDALVTIFNSQYFPSNGKLTLVNGAPNNDPVDAAARVKGWTVEYVNA